MNKYVLSVLVENHSGVLSKISGLFSRRGYNIHSLTVGITEDPNVSRMTIVVSGCEQILEQINKQLNKLIDVIKITSLDSMAAVYRELALIKVAMNQGNQSIITETVNIFRGNIVDMDVKSMTIEITGDEEKVTAFIDLMKPHGIKEIVRTGLTALERG
ncbi:acetolactate synthase small subunit [Clostridium thailandense]|uniref:Acetolactate synthase small subunit n=1 Tax=Clostridium thailandense TaxID=2794346 RepID=A0A949X500_9CLOT|nr:acetolactate synthase small subunit [Clostridium thailandense]MBV7274833.1 acetolactate synthase small subunit [Clostridium thailandense]MCH5137997.1 acetolactate synthase small subunit [Clostridiaceae bacterium UIB06]